MGRVAWRNESSAPAGLLTELILPVNCECDIISDHAPAPPATPTSMLADSLLNPIRSRIGGINFASSETGSLPQL